MKIDINAPLNETQSETFRIAGLNERGVAGGLVGVLEQITEKVAPKPEISDGRAALPGRSNYCGLIFAD